MLSTPELNAEHVRLFQETGFTVLPGAFAGPEVEDIRRWAQEIADLPEEPGKHWVYHETSLIDDRQRLINRIENMTPFHRGWAEIAHCLIPAVSQLLGEEAVLFKDKINFKMPGGDGFKPHQDAQAGWQKYASYFVNVLVCIDEATLENGCLELAPRHNAALVGAEWTPLNEEETSTMDFRPYPTRPGDAIFFDSYAPHRSAPNLTDRTRRIYFATYNRLSEGDHLAAYYADKRKSFPPDIERESGREYVYRV